MATNFEEWRLEDYFQIFRLHKWLIVWSTLACSALTAIQVAQSPNIYKTFARILIETQRAQVVQFQEVSAVSPWDISFLQTEYQVISSRAVLSRVIEDLNLASFAPFSNAKDPVQVLQKCILVNPVRGTKLVDIATTGTKPDLIARIANSVADTYAKVNLERRRELTTGGAQWLREEVDKMEVHMRETETKLQEFREQHGATDFGEQNQSSVMQRLQGLNAALTKVREDRIDAEVKYREKHPTVLELTAKERELQLALFDQEQRALELSRLSIQYTALLRETKTSEAIYNILLTRLKELSVQEGVQSNNVQVVDYAQVPDKPVGPARSKRTILSAIVGFLLGCGVSLLREFFTKTIRTRQEFERALEIPFLGHVPVIAGERARSGTKTLALVKDPKSPVSETIRSVRTTLEFILPAGENHILLITSALPEEGKSTICANLGIALHELGRKVLLIDADLRRPSLHRYFGVNLEPGLSGFLQETVTEQELIQPVPSVEGLQVIAAGLTPSQPTDLLGNPKLREFLKNCRQQYSYVLIDSPPVLVAADTSVLSALVEGVVYLVRANRTHSEAAVAGKQRLVDVSAKILGGVLNGARLELERGYRYYYSNRYYQETDRKRSSGRRPGAPRRIPPAPDETPLQEKESG